MSVESDEAEWAKLRKYDGLSDNRKEMKDLAKRVMDRAKESIDKAAEEINKKNAALRAKSKPKEDLIVSIDCTVESVLGHNYQTSHTPRSEMIIGGESPVYSGGYVSKLELEVKTNTEVKKLTFKGWPPIEKGDKIRAYIFKGEEKSEIISVFDPSYNTESKTLYVERYLNEKETAIKIEKLRKGKIVATYLNK